MSTAAIGSTSGTPSATTGSSTAGSSLNINPTDFIKMMITQLQNQDPLQPEQSDQLLSQMSQIGQLQSSNQLQTTLTGLASQSQIGAASALIGKRVSGQDDQGAPLSGVVSSVKVSSGGVSLQLDSGKALGLSNVLSIAPAGTTAAAA